MFTVSLQRSEAQPRLKMLSTMVSFSALNAQVRLELSYESVFLLRHFRSVAALVPPSLY